MGNRSDTDRAPADDRQEFLFDIKVPEQPTAAARSARPSTSCSVCGRALRSRKSVDAGAGQTCAAKVGRSVLASIHKSGRARVEAAA